MRRVKLFVIYEKEIDSDDYYNQVQILSGSNSDWEEISEEDYQLIRNHAWNLGRKNKCQYVLIEDDTLNILDRIKSIKDLIKKQEQERLEFQEKREQQEKEQKKKLEQKKIEQAKKLLKAKGLLSND